MLAQVDVKEDKFEVGKDKVDFFQQGKIDKDLRTNLLFQQGKNDTAVSKLKFLSNSMVSFKATNDALPCDDGSLMLVIIWDCHGILVCICFENLWKILAFTYWMESLWELLVIIKSIKYLRLFFKFFFFLIFVWILKMVNSFFFIFLYFWENFSGDARLYPLQDFLGGEVFFEFL